MPHHELIKGCRIKHQIAVPLNTDLLRLTARVIFARSNSFTALSLRGSVLCDRSNLLHAKQFKLRKQSWMFFVRRSNVELSWKWKIVSPRYTRGRRSRNSLARNDNKENFIGDACAFRGVHFSTTSRLFPILSIASARFTISRAKPLKINWWNG